MKTIEIGIASISDRVLSVSIDYQGDASPLVKKWHADRAVVDGIGRDIDQAVADALAEAGAASAAGDEGEAENVAAGETGEAADRFRSLGLALFQEIMKDECDHLRDLGSRIEGPGGPSGAAGAGGSGRSDGASRANAERFGARAKASGAGESGDGDPTYLVFRIDKSLAYLPLELMHDGAAFLAHRFAVGRVIYAESAGAREARPRRPPHTALVIGDPSGDQRISRDVEDEIDSLRDVIRQTGDYSPRLAVGEEADMKFILANLPGAAVFHFSGHGVVAEDEQHTGLELSRGQVLSGYSLRGLQDAPGFAFLNVCTPASKETWKGSLGIVETLLRRGTQACISSLWEVRSRTAAILASRFYAHLLRGQTFGEALRLARTATAAEAGLGDPTWAAYALYGDPRGRLAEKPPQGEAEAADGGRVSRRTAIVTALVLGAAAVAVGILLGLPARIAVDDFTESTGTADGGALGGPTEAGQQSPAEAAQVGYLLIESIPSGADILIDGERVGVTPYSPEVEVGMHEVVLEKQGYRRWEASVEVKIAPRSKVTANLEKIK